jgi:hypothetical protein
MRNELVDSTTTGSSEEAPPSPFIGWSLAECREHIVRRFNKQEGTNFVWAINILRRMHKNFEGIPINSSSNTTTTTTTTIEDNDVASDPDTSTQWLYPCQSSNDDCDHFFLLQRKAKAGVRQQLCSMCLLQWRQVARKEGKRQQRSSSFSSTSFNRRSPFTAMNVDELQDTIKDQSLQLLKANMWWRYYFSLNFQSVSYLVCLSICLCYSCQ